MKTIRLILCGAAMLPLSAHAQFIVNDPVAVAQSAVQHIREQKSDSSGTRLVKELERVQKRLEVKLEKLSADDKKDATLTFEELGVDRLFVDEAHKFKNLFYVTKMTRVAGLPQTASERAFDLFLKVQHIQDRNEGGGVVFATGTPISNTMAEMFTMQRYLQMNSLRRHGLQHFDSWAGTFGETVTAMELSPDGAGYRLNHRFARFVNVPELMQEFRRTADVQTAEMLKLPIPKLETGKAITVSAPCSPALKSFVAHLVERAAKLKGSRVDPRVDNMLIRASIFATPLRHTSNPALCNAPASCSCVQPRWFRSRLTCGPMRLRFLMVRRVHPQIFHGLRDFVFSFGCIMS